MHEPFMRFKKYITIVSGFLGPEPGGIPQKEKDRPPSTARVACAK